jgi:imidazolonepropionase
MKFPDRYVVCCSRVVTCELARSTDSDPLGVVCDGAILVDSGVIEAAGPRELVLQGAQGAPIAVDEPGCVMTPGLVDAHTHLVWAGSRHDEYAMRMAGKSYEAIAAAGGGIVSTMQAVRGASEQQLVASSAARLRRMAALGTTTCEIKSGYGLDLENELKQLHG